ncbi:MAG: hypothetical protein FJZ47_05260 [Candidatus Tectomicrobia bacterium]|uniref:Transposase zinc-binding domain-containing protein n=1 Tax=Tectimicrobiota bacterium TaxID=2528274 RepID=A0A938B2X2_UNCTE|nr:hypothetical protein [Candidatus Tectomicrobia bacterium]
MALVTLQTIFHDALPAYAQSHPLPAHVRRAARAIMPCRTAALGGHIQACPDGPIERIWSNACRQRSCPQWSYLRPSAGAPSNGPGSWPATMIMSSSPCHTTSIPWGSPTCR